MQSTHNTVGATLGIYTKTHGYNTTYSHGDLSFDLTLLDAWMQMQLGKIRTALVGGQDEMSELYFSLLQKAGYVGLEGMDPCGEVAMSMMLNCAESPENLCELAEISVGLLSSADQLKDNLTKMLDEAGMTMDDISAVMTGVSGNPANDQTYRKIIDAVFQHMPLLHYKHLFGENYTVSALGVYAAAHCLKKGVVPSFLYDDQSQARCDQPKAILLLNHMKGKEFSLILLKKI
jgi:3-oxoacyl-(acyl-carrier-protein) synthase